MKRAAIAILAGLLCIGSPTVQADNSNPFGFETNTHPLEYEYCKKADFGTVNSRYLYRCSSAPRPHPDLEDYVLFFVEDVGLCTIAAASLGEVSSGNPQNIRDLIEKFKEQIAKKYGPPTRKSDEEFECRYDWNPKAGFNGLGDVAKIWLERIFSRGGYKSNRSKSRFQTCNS